MNFLFFHQLTWPDSISRNKGRTLLDPAAALESAVSSSGPSRLAISEEDESSSIIELLFTGNAETGFNMLFCFPSEDWKAMTWILPT